MVEIYRAGGGLTNKIRDADNDTKIQVEESADEDIVRMDVANVEAFHLSAVGIQTLVKQSRGRAYLATANQVIPDNSATHVKLNAEAYDIQNEFDTSVISGTADATEANKLHDEDGGFSAGDVGKTVWNKTDNTYTTVSGFVDSGELDLTDDIIADTETYDLFFSRWTASEDGTYLIMATCRVETMADGTWAYIYLYKNSTQVFIARFSAGGVIYGQPLAITIMELSADDYISFQLRHNIGSNQEVSYRDVYTSLTVAKLY